MPPIWKTVTVGAAAVLALGKSKDRTTIVIYNTSANTIYWDHHPTVTVTSGGPVVTNQSVILQECDNDFTHEPIYLIAAAGDNDVRIYESTKIGSLLEIFRELR